MAATQTIYVQGQPILSKDMTTGQKAWAITKAGGKIVGTGVAYVTVGALSVFIGTKLANRSASE